MLSAHLASIPSREPTLRLVIESIAPYVDHTFVALSGYSYSPTWLSEFPTVTSKILSNERGDANKFAFINEVKGRVLITDDDLLWNPPAINLLQEKVRKYGCPCSYHGKRYKRPFVSFKQIEGNYRCLGSVDKDQLNIDIIGTGVMMFDLDVIRPTMDDFEHKNMSDILFSRLCYKNGVPMVVVAHKAGVVGYLNPKETIWNQTKDYSLHNAIIKDFLK